MDGGELLELHCPICYGEQGDSGYSTLVCGHIFHEKCLAQSLRIKKECPSCRCPARPLDTGRRDANSQPKCPCKTGQPLRLFHLQRPRNGADAASSLSQLAAGAAGPAVDSAVLVAAEQRAAQRESRLREALVEERERAALLDAELERQMAELAKAQAKAERRKERLAALEREHQLAANRLTEDKSRLEARERELTEELTRVRQALHGTRMDLDKARAVVYERDDAVMRLKRELAMQRARAGGSAALQPREMVELLGERKEDWQAVYSMKVEELRRAHEVAAELRAEVLQGKRDADMRVAAERLAGTERIKAVALERDDAKRELMELEYKLHEAQRRLNKLQSSPSTAGAAKTARATATTTVGPTAERSTRGPLPPAAATSGRGSTVVVAVAGTAAAPPGCTTAAGAAAAAVLTTRAGAAPPRTAPKQQQRQQQPQQQLQQSAPGVWLLSLPGAVVGEADVSATADKGGGGDVGSGDDDDEDGEGDLDALALEAIGCLESQEGDEDQDQDRDHGLVGVFEENGEEECWRGTGGGAGRGAARGRRGGGGDDGGSRTDEDDLADDSTPYDVATATVEDAPPPSKRQRHDACGGSDDDVQVHGREELVDDSEPVPLLPRAFSGLFTAPAAPTAAAGPSNKRRVSQGDQLGPGGAGPCSMAPAAATFLGFSLASRATAAADAARWIPGGPSGRGNLLGEGPDGRGGTTRFPLTSSFTHNAGARKAPTVGKGAGTRGGGGGARPGMGGGPQGRIDTFLRRIPQPHRR